MAMTLPSDGSSGRSWGSQPWGSQPWGSQPWGSQPWDLQQAPVSASQTGDSAIRGTAHPFRITPEIVSISRREDHDSIWQVFQRTVLSSFFYFTSIFLSVVWDCVCIALDTSLLDDSEFVGRLHLKVLTLLVFEFKVGYKQLLYVATLTWAAVKHVWDPDNHPWCHKMDENIVLGRLPLQNFGHHEGLKEEGVTHVLSIVEPFELETNGPLTAPVSTKHWKDLGITQKHVITADYGGVSLQTIDEVVEWLFTLIGRPSGEEKGDPAKVYVHCRGGVGRSSSLVIAYYMRANRWTFKQAYAYVKNRRPVIHLNKRQQRAVEYYGEFLQKVQKISRKEEGGSVDVAHMRAQLLDIMQKRQVLESHLQGGWNPFTQLTFSSPPNENSAP